MRVLLSIKPEFAKKIFSGEKKFEFRRSLFKKPNIKEVVVYASAPISMVIGKFEIEEVIFQDITTLWKMTQEYSGITKRFFTEYFQGKQNGFAIKIRNPVQFKEHLLIGKSFGIKPPQSFAYVK